MRLTSAINTNPNITNDSIDVYLANLSKCTGDTNTAKITLLYLKSLGYYLLGDEKKSEYFLDKSSLGTNAAGLGIFSQLLVSNYIKPPKVPDKIKVYCQFLLDYSYPRSNEWQTFISYSIMERIYELEEDVPQAFVLNYKILDIPGVRNGDYMALKSFVYSNLGRLSRMMGEYDKAIKYHQDALLFTPDTSVNLRAIRLNHLANVANSYRESGRFQKSLQMDKEVLAKRLQMNDANGIIYQRTSLAISLIN